MHNVLDELDYFGYAVFHEWFVFNPLSELVDGNIDVLKITFRSFVRSNLVKPPA